MTQGAEFRRNRAGRDEAARYSLTFSKPVNRQPTPSFAK